MMSSPTARIMGPAIAALLLLSGCSVPTTGQWYPIATGELLRAPAHRVEIHVPAGTLTGLGPTDEAGDGNG